MTKFNKSENWKIICSKDVEKDIKKRKLNVPTTLELISKSKKLKDYKLWSYRVNDKFRIILIINCSSSEINLIRFDNRDKVYDNLKTLIQKTHY